VVERRLGRLISFFFDEWSLIDQSIYRVARHSFGLRFAQRQVYTGTLEWRVKEGKGKEGTCGVHGARGISTIVASSLVD
jgi:hypothetical protein